jgi:exopolysaccharide biosynthesis polyprenyl glycosylphosphotransferase
MTKPRNSDFFIPTLTIVFDILAIEAAFLFSYWLRFNTEFLAALRVGGDIPSFITYFVSSLFIIPIWILVLLSKKSYIPHRNVTLSNEFFQIIKAITIGMLIIIGAAFFYRGFSYSRFVVVVLWISSIFFVLSGRGLIHFIRKELYRKGKELRNTVIIGNNDTADILFEKLQNNIIQGYKLAGYLADAETSTDLPLSNCKYLGKIDDAYRTFNEHGIELAFITLGYTEHPKIYNLLRQTEGVNVGFMIVPDILELMTSRYDMRDIGGIPFINIKGIPMTTWGRIVKRVFDIIFSAVVLVVFSPLILSISILIKLNSRGPIFYTQERVGLDGQSFKVFKFRTMRTDAEKSTGPVWATKDDPRVTKVGKFLRRTSLDEIPQFINTLLGDMSVVGPRPERPHFVNQFKDVVPKYLDRHLLKTGITGWAQVNGLRGQAPIEERTKYDLYYIENWSVVFDIKIILKTVHTIVFGKDAY